jgi:hypothetical protein
MANPTTRRGIASPIGGDLVNAGAADFEALADYVDTDVFYTSGVFSSRPAAGVEGRMYRATDVTNQGPSGTWYLDTGTDWYELPSQARTQTGAVHLYLTTAQSIAASNLTTIGSLSAEFGSSAWYDLALARYEPPRTGVYRISATVQMLDPLTTGSLLTLVLLRNSSTFRTLDQGVGTATSGMVVAGSTLVSFTAGSGDVFSMGILHTDTTSGTRRVASGTDKTFLDACFVSA